jgi:hypothetical protein
MSAAEILHEVDVPGVFRDIFKNGSRPLKLQAVNALWDRAFGKPKQDVDVKGGIVHAHTVYRDPLLAALSDRMRS